MNGDAAPQGPSQLRRVVSLPQLTASAVGIIIGAGIYVLLAPATSDAGAMVWLSFLLAAALAALTGFSYAELSAMFPRAGSEFEYARHAFPLPIAFVTGWLAAAALVVASAAVSLGFARYLTNFVDMDERVAALGLIAVVTLSALRGIEHSVRLTIALGVIEVGGLLAVIAIGVPHIGDVDLLESNGTGGIIAAAALIFFAFLGFDEVVTLAEEAEHPTRNVPRALLIGLAISAVLYMSVAIAAVSVLGADTLGASPRPLADVFATAVGDRSAQVVTAIALVATTNTTLLALVAGSRVFYGMAQAGSFHPSLGRVSGRTGAPNEAIMVVALGAAGFALLGDPALVASVTDAAVFVVFVSVNASVIVLRFRQPEVVRPFRSPIAIGRLPLLPILGLAGVVFLLPELTPRALVLGALLTAAGFLIYRFGPHEKTVPA